MALGMIEVFGFATSIVVADAMAKAADVKVVAIDKNKPAAGDAAKVPLVMAIKVHQARRIIQMAQLDGNASALEHLIKPVKQLCLGFCFGKVGAIGGGKMAEEAFDFQIGKGCDFGADIRRFLCHLEA